MSRQADYRTFRVHLIHGDGAKQIFYVNAPMWATADDAAREAERFTGAIEVITDEVTPEGKLVAA